MSEGLELHDAEVGAITHQLGMAVITIVGATLHRSEGVAGVDPGSCWLQAAEIVVHRTALPQQLPKLPGWLLDGTVKTADVEHSNVLYTPFRVDEACTLELVFDNDIAFNVAAGGVELRLIGEASYLREFR